MTKEEIIELAREALKQEPREDWNSTAWVFADETLQAFARLVAEHVYAEYLELPEPKQSDMISITTPVPIGYLCENAVGHKYFRWKKPTSTYKPIALYTALPEQGDKHD